MKSVIIIGGGSSVKEGIDTDLWNKIKGHEVWSINFAFMTMPYLPTREVWVDYTFFKNNVDKLQKLYESGVQCVAKAHKVYDNIPEITQFNGTRDIYKGSEMLALRELFIGRMGLSGLFALSLAVAEGYDCIYLLGYDFGTSSVNNTTTHYYQGEKLDIKSHGVGNPGVYMEDYGVKKDVQEFEHYLKSNSKIYNVSQNSNIRAFEKIDYPTFYKYLKCDKLVNLIQNS